MDEERKARLKGSFAGARKRFLSVNHPADYARLVKAGEMESHLMRIGEEAADLYLTLEDQLKAKAEEITDQNEQAAYLSQIPHMAREMVLKEVIEVRS